MMTSERSLQKNVCIPYTKQNIQHSAKEETKQVIFIHSDDLWVQKYLQKYCEIWTFAWDEHKTCNIKMLNCYLGINYGPNNELTQHLRQSSLAAALLVH